VRQWFLLLRDDPRIPLRHLPAAWPGVAAEKLFHRLHARLAPAARRITDAMLDFIKLD
jgi:phenylacetic acid degradation operon negative regulatory protein